MRLFKRISSTVLASVDKVVSEVENHDAVVESMLLELKQAEAESKVRLKRVQQDGKNLRQQLETLKESENNWTTRASKLANDSDSKNDNKNQQKALACLERRQTCREQITKLNSRLEQHGVTEQTLFDQLQKIENRRSEMNDKRHLFQSQQAVAEANRVVSAVTGSGKTDINEAFDRWEISIAKKETLDCNSILLDTENIDALDLEFKESENNANLLAELAELKASDSKKTS